MKDYLEALLLEQAQLPEEAVEPVLAEVLTDDGAMQRLRRAERQAVPEEAAENAAAEKQAEPGQILAEGAQKDRYADRGLTELAAPARTAGDRMTGSDPEEAGKSGGGAVLLRAVQKANRNLPGQAGAAPGRYAAGERYAQRQAVQAAQLSMREIDLAFQRDSRRYDNGFRLF